MLLDYVNPIRIIKKAWLMQTKFVFLEADKTMANIFVDNGDQMEINCALKNHLPAVSVVIPVYNREKTIERSIRSVLGQSYRNLELIVVDDCSTDDTANIVNSITDSRIKYIRHVCNQGACIARNTGIENAIGEYIAFQDSDDYWQSDKLGKQLVLMQNMDAGICFCSIHRHDYPKKQLEFYPDLETGKVKYEQLILQSIASTQTIVVKRSIADQYQFDPEVKRLQDYDWIIRAGEKNKVVFVREAVVDVYLQSDSITAMGYETLLETYMLFLTKYKYLFEKYPKFHANLLETVGNYKTILQKRAIIEYKEAYKACKSLKLILKRILSQLGLLRLIYRHRI